MTSAKFLSEQSLPIVDTNVTKQRLEVPPCTPISEFEFDVFLECLPNTFPELNNITLPSIREIGVKRCIDELGKLFSCKDYKFNLIQFWFLDTIAECIWKCQDEYNFPEEKQKTVLGWILFLVDMIRDVTKNFSRKDFFQMFKEAIIMASEIVSEECEVPLPNDLFDVILENEIHESWKSSTSGSLMVKSSELDTVSYLEVGIDEEPDLYELPKVVHCYDIPSTKSSSAESGTFEECVEEEEIKFYQPDYSIHSRFLDVPEPPYEPYKTKSYSSTTIVSDQDLITEKEELKNSAYENISRSWESVQEEGSLWSDIMAKENKQTVEIERMQIINLGILWAIIDFVFDHFYETFQFVLVKHALQQPQPVITQNLNSDWYVPKVPIKELAKPKEAKPKKEKSKKPPKPPKSPKSPKSPREPKAPKPKKEKPVKPSKAELKAEKERLKKEQARLAEEMRIKEENRRFLFPLNDAATDDIFQGAFENWVRPAAKGKGKKK